ncbi:MAG TPA: aminopeptidase N [Vicinamibacteria bacterium]|nr:aminopeptidase N [Vicinamibacteria bacterium]
MGRQADRLRVAIATVGLLAGSIGTISAGAAARARPSADKIDQEQAELRRAQVRDLAYAVELDLTNSERYSGRVIIDVTLTDTTTPLTVDFGGGHVRSVVVNGASAEHDYNGFFLTLAAGLRRPGSNRIEIEFEHPFATDGNGLHRFVDPEDRRTYLYTYLWPYYANRLFPCLDQPDLKASYRVEVLAPAEWVVISTMGETSVEPLPERRKRWRFPASPPLSTYIYSLHAGPYHEWQGNAGEIPLRLFARRSLARHVDSAEWLTVTRQGLDFYARYFEIPHPFGKYDQLLVPDFNIGAMENAAAVTFGESYVSRGQATRAERERRAKVILHEMAHMWFGNLVTKRWWNGLWLNESFATLMATKAMVATEFGDAWHEFYLDSKRSAYKADDLTTTHPIETPIPDTASFFDVLDSITYGKGASVLQQLSHVVGPEPFRAGVSAYLKRHSWSNTRLRDFTNAVAEAAHLDLEEWVDQWLYARGFDTLAAVPMCEDGRLRRLAIRQSGPSIAPILRGHRAQLALYGLDQRGRLAIEATLPMDVSGRETIVGVGEGRPCPALIDPNHGDWGYFRADLDPESLASLERSLRSLREPLTRSVMWDTLWEMTRRSRLSLGRFLEIALVQGGAETDDRVLAQVLDAMLDALAYLQRLQPESRPQLTTWGPRIERFLATGLVEAAAGSDAQKIWFDHVVQGAHSAAALDRLAAWLDGIDLPVGFHLDQDRRWTVLIQLAAHAHRRSDELVMREKEHDGSDYGRRSGLAADAARPQEETKRRWLSTFRDAQSPIPFSNQREAMKSLFPKHQVELQTALLPEVVDSLSEMAGRRDPYFLKSYAQSLLEASCRQEAVDAMSRTLPRVEADPTLRRALLEARQEAETCLMLGTFNGLRARASP